MDNNHEVYERLKDLAAMRLLHHMPAGEALREWNSIYKQSRTDLDGLMARRERAIAHFKALGFEGEPESGPLFKR